MIRSITPVSVAGAEGAGGGGKGGEMKTGMRKPETGELEKSGKWEIGKSGNAKAEG
jgi:hypothetical protein